MVCTCTSCNHFSISDLKKSVKKLCCNLQQGTPSCQLYETFLSLVMVLDKTPMNDHTMRHWDQEFEEDPYLQAYDAFAELFVLLKLLKAKVQHTFYVNWHSLNRMEYVYFMYFIQNYVNSIFKNCFDTSYGEAIPGTAGYLCMQLKKEIRQITNLFSQVIVDFNGFDPAVVSNNRMSTSSENSHNSFAMSHLTHSTASHERAR